MTTGVRIIELEGVVAGYGRLTILDGVTLDARAGEVTLLIGPNGAGKSTVLKTIFGLVRARQGAIRLAGEAIGHLAPRALLERGLAFVPQGRNLFPALSVLHNLELGGIALPRVELRRRIDEVLERFPRIRERAASQASTLSGGEQKQLEIGRALLLRPKILLVDEPSIGLAPKISQEVFGLLRTLADGGVTVLMVEQNVKSALAVAERAVALESGRVVLDRPAAALLGDPDLGRLFLGGSATAAPPA